MGDISVNELSNSDLRKRLSSYGFDNVGPITATTRGLFEKKLAKLIEKAPVINGNDSAKQDDVVITNTTRASRTGRRSMSRKFAPLSSDDEDLNHTADNSKKSNNNESKSAKNEFVDPNDILISPSVKNSFTNVTFRSQNRRTSSQASLPASSVSTPITIPTNTTISNASTKSKLSSYGKTLNNEFSDDDFPTTTESSMSNISSRKDTASHTTHRYKHNEISSANHNSDTREHSDQTTSRKDESVKLTSSRNSSARNSPVNNKINIPNMQDEINKSLIQIRKSYTSKRPSPNAKHTSIEHVHEKNDEDEEIDAEFVPEVSYGRMIKDSITWFRIFSFTSVLLLIGLYLYNGDVNNIPSMTGSGKGGEKLKHYQVINCFYQKLSVLSGDAECGYAKDKWVKKGNIREFAKPCLVGNETPDTLNFTVYKDFFAVNENGDISSKFAYRSLGCRISQAVSVVMMRVIMIVTAIACIIGGYFVMKKRWAEDDEQTRQILHFVERIIETLQRHHEVCQVNKDLPSFLPIPHVRDMLIPLAKRKQMAKTWRKAVAFLNSSDSRVRVETQRIAGEDFDVWRWIGVSTPKLKKEKKATNETYLSNDHDKCWQGPAFDAIEKVVRMPIVTPTPCLKIRYMHEGHDEKGEAWMKRVENAVLEKCSQDGAQILHIFVDKSSKEGCVYVKCDSLESAGKAFRCMYGNWFDSRLVIVKFVTLARYHQRFPDALKCLAPLQCDAEVPSSLNWVADE